MRWEEATMKLKRPEIILTIIGIVLLLAAVFSYLRHQSEKGEEIGNYPKKVHGGACPGETKTLTANDVYMRGVLEKGQPYKVVMNYYDCQPVKDGEYVLYSLSENLDPVVKIVRAVGGDHFKLSKDKKHGAWNLIVNDEMVKNVTDNQPYFFGGEMPATLSLYEKSHKGVLHNDEVILLSSWAPGDSDSGIFGVFNVTDIVGKVEIGKSDGENEDVKKEDVKTAAKKARGPVTPPEVKPGVPIKAKTAKAPTAPKAIASPKPKK
jgi:hypothetical protein